MPKEGSDTVASPEKETLPWTARSQRKATFLSLDHHDAYMRHSGLMGQNVLDYTYQLHLMSTESW